MQTYESLMTSLMTSVLSVTDWSCCWKHWTSPEECVSEKITDAGKLTKYINQARSYCHCFTLLDNLWEMRPLPLIFTCWGSTGVQTPVLPSAIIVTSHWTTWKSNLGLRLSACDCSRILVSSILCNECTVWIAGPFLSNDGWPAHDN